MRTLIAASLAAVLIAPIPPGSLQAHHSLANFDTTKAVRVRGTVIQIRYINPHSYLFLEQKSADGQTVRWAAEGPAQFQLERKSSAADVLTPGVVVEVCGYLPKETIIWQIASADPRVVSLAGRLINAETLVMPDGQEHSWGDYGVHKCFEAGHRDQHPQ